MAIDEKGKRLTGSKTKEISEHVWGIITDAFQYSNESKSIPFEKTLKDFFNEEVARKDVPAEDKKLILQLAEQVSVLLCSLWLVV